MFDGKWRSAVSTFVFPCNDRQQFSESHIVLHGFVQSGIWHNHFKTPSHERKFWTSLLCLSRLFFGKETWGTTRTCTVNKPCMTVRLLKFRMSLRQFGFPKLINKIQQINPYRNRTPYIKHPQNPPFILDQVTQRPAAAEDFLDIPCLGEFLSHAGLNLPCLLHVLLWHLSIINVALKALAAGKNAMPHTPGKDANLVEKTLKKKRKKKGWLGCFQHLCFFFAISVFWAGGGGDLVSKKKRRKAFQTWSKLLQKEGS